jgi:hypothetical protein
MTRTSTNEFLNPDGSINYARAINAGHEARTQALGDMYVAVAKMIKVKLMFSAKNEDAPASSTA